MQSFIFKRPAGRVSLTSYVPVSDAHAGTLDDQATSAQPIFF